jgi:hypothetical protein
MPQSGKSIVIENVAFYFRNKGIPVGEYSGGSRYDALHDAPIEDLNLELANNALKFINLKRHDKEDHKIYLLDRSLIDRCIFTNTLFQQHTIDEDEAKHITKLLTIPRLLQTLDGVFIFITSPELALDREDKSKVEISAKGLQTSRGVMNYPFLSDMQLTSTAMYNELMNNMGDLLPNVQLYDTALEDGKIEEIIRRVIDNIEEIIQQ